MSKAIGFLLIISLFTNLNMHAQAVEKAFETNFIKAKDLAKNQDKSILMIFAGSDWCRPCKMFKKQVLDTEPFYHFVEDNLIILYLDFPSKKKNKLSEEQKAHNESLAEQFNPEGSFPKILLMQQNDEPPEVIQYRSQNANQFIQLIQSKI
jgi:thioredoxin-related protein